MPRYYKKKYFKSKDKYSVEQTAFQAALTPSESTAVDIVPAVSTQGMRKVKHITVSASASGACWWALMYLPQGVTISGINVTTGQPLVEPNQFCMNCGVFDGDAGPIRVSSGLSRNLNSGDKVILVIRPMAATGQTSFSGVARYAITLQ